MCVSESEAGGRWRECVCEGELGGRKMERVSEGWRESV